MITSSLGVPDCRALMSFAFLPIRARQSGTPRLGNLVLVTRTRVVRWLPDMRSVCVTVTEGARVVVSGRAIRVDDSATLSSVQ